jgi:hypothetical protein
MGVRTRGLDIKAGAAKLKADRAEAELIVDRWNRRLAAGRDMMWSPTIRAALLAGTPWLDVFCPGCGTIAFDLSHQLAPPRAGSFRSDGHRRPARIACWMRRPGSLEASRPNVLPRLVRGFFLLTREQRLCVRFAFWTNSVRGMFVDKSGLGTTPRAQLCFGPTAGYAGPPQLRRTIRMARGTVKWFNSQKGFPGPVYGSARNYPMCENEN